MHARDTTPEAAAIQEEGYRQLGPSGRFKVAAELTNAVRELARAGIRRRHPEYTDEQVARQMASYIYGLNADDCED
jgi:hypothetical protein